MKKIVCGYNPCGNSRAESNTMFQQHCRYFINSRNLTKCPRAHFQEDLMAALQEWHNKGHKLIVCFDANEDVYKKSIGKALTDRNGLAMKEVVGEFNGQKLGATFFWGSKPIDVVWATDDVKREGACVMPAGYGIGDHRLFVIDIHARSILGDIPQ